MGFRVYYIGLYRRVTEALLEGLGPLSGVLLGFGNRRFSDSGFGRFFLVVYIYTYRR